MPLPQQSVVSVGSVGVEGDITDDTDLGDFSSERTDCAADEVIWIDRLAALFGF